MKQKRIFSQENLRNGITNILLSRLVTHFEEETSIARNRTAKKKKTLWKRERKRNPQMASDFSYARKKWRIYSVLILPPLSKKISCCSEVSLFFRKWFYQSFSFYASSISLTVKMLLVVVTFPIYRKRECTSIRRICTIFGKLHTGETKPSLLLLIAYNTPASYNTSKFSTRWRLQFLSNS